ncbi:MAG: DUF6252 family protein [Chitinophagaceae bacterium]
MKYILFFLPLFLLAAACNKQIKELPQPTDTGANIFGAKVDSMLWAPKGFGLAATAPVLEARYGEGRSVVINARNFAKEPTETEFEIYLYNVTAPGTYYLNTNTGIYPNQHANYAYYIERKISPVNEWMTTSVYTGTVTITKADTMARIVAGTFQFNAINRYGTPKAISVTEGRFDIKIP